MYTVECEFSIKQYNLSFLIRIKDKRDFILKKKKKKKKGNRTQSCESGDEVRDSKCKFGLFCFVAPLVKFCDQLGQNNPDNYQKLKNNFSKKEVI